MQDWVYEAQLEQTNQNQAQEKNQAIRRSEVEIDRIRDQKENKKMHTEK